MHEAIAWARVRAVTKVSVKWYKRQCLDRGPLPFLVLKGTVMGRPGWPALGPPEVKPLIW